jgi:pilus assembly protein Flp/PilA
MGLVKLLMLPRDQNGATAIEYALIASLISIGILAAIQSMSATLSGTFTTVAAAL